MPISRVLRPQAYAAADARPSERLAGYAPCALIVPGRGTVHFTETTYGDDGGLNALAEENAEAFVFSNRFQIINLGSLCRVADLDSHTVVLSCRLDSFPQVYTIPVGYTDTAGSNRQSFIYSTGGSYTDISFGRNGAGAAPQRIALTQFGPVVGTRHNIAVRKSGGTATFFVNGQAVTPGSAGAFGGATGNASLGQIAAGNNSYGFIGQVYAFALFDGLLPDALLEENSADPIKALLAPRQIWVPVAAAAATTLAADAATHGHSADSPALVAASALAAQDARHGHAADNAVLDTAATTALAAADARHAQAADSAALTTVSTLAAADAAHGHSADSPALAAASALAAQDARHGHAADSAVLGTGSTAVLAAADARHAHSADIVVTGLSWALLGADARHAHKADSLTLLYDAVAPTSVPELLFASLGPLVGQRCYPNAFPQAPALQSWPAIRYNILSEETDPDQCGSGDESADDTRVQIDVVAKCYSEMRTMKTRVIAALQVTDPPCIRTGGLELPDFETKTERAVLFYTFHASSP